MNKNCYLIITGGTGGHIFPAIAIAQELKERNLKYKIVVIGPKIQTRAIEQNTKAIEEMRKTNLKITANKPIKKPINKNRNPIVPNSNNGFSLKVNKNFTANKSINPIKILNFPLYLLIPALLEYNLTGISVILNL